MPQAFFSNQPVHGPIITEVNDDGPNLHTTSKVVEPKTQRASIKEIPGFS